MGRHVCTSAAGLLLAIGLVGRVGAQETTTESETTVTTSTTLAPTTTTTHAPSTTLPPTTPAPTTPPIPTDTYAVGCTIDGILCTVKKNATLFVASLQGYDEVDAAEVLGEAYGLLSINDDTEGVVGSSRNLRSSSFAAAAPTTTTYYYAGSMSYQAGLMEVGWDIVNVTLAEDTEVRVLSSLSAAGASGIEGSAPLLGKGDTASASYDTNPLTLNTRYYAVGYLEGYVTYQKILQNYINTYKTTIEAIFAESAEVQMWLQRNSDWVLRYASLSAVNSDDPFAAKLSNVMMQMKGLANGFADACAANPTVCTPSQMGSLLSNNAEMALLAMNMFTELPDVLSAFATTVTPNGTAVNKSPLLQKLRNATTAGQGSAFVKVVGDHGVKGTDGSSGGHKLLRRRSSSPTQPKLQKTNKASFGGPADTVYDLLFAQSAWAPYQSMMRQYKTYNFEGELMIGMSSRPGLIYSQDDWYMNGNGLTVTQTMLPIFDEGLFVSAGLSTNFAGVPSFYRTLVATYLSDTIDDWQSYFTYYSLGTANSQWLVVDMKHFDGSDTIDGDNPVQDEGCLLVLETMPGGVVVAKDMSGYLANTGAFGSYNLAFFDTIAQLSGQSAMLVSMGSYFDVERSPRARQFAALSSNVTDVSSMVSFMRLNRYDINTTHTVVIDGNQTIVVGEDYAKYSLIPNCDGATNGECNPATSAVLAVSGRGDLNPVGSGVASFGVLSPVVGQMNLGGIDVKVTTRNSMVGHTKADFRAFIISGPSNDDQPTFSFSGAVAASSPCKALFDTVSHVGLPDAYDFDVIVVASVPQVPPRPQSRNYKHSPLVGIFGSAVGCLFGSIVVVMVTCTKHNRAPHKGYRPLTGGKKQLLWLEQDRARRKAAREAKARAVADGTYYGGTDAVEREEDNEDNNTNRREGGGGRPLQRSSSKNRMAGSPKHVSNGSIVSAVEMGGGGGGTTPPAKNRLRGESPAARTVEDATRATAAGGRPSSRAQSPAASPPTRPPPPQGAINRNTPVPSPTNNSYQNQMYSAPSSPSNNNQQQASTSSRPPLHGMTPPPTPSAGGGSVAGGDGVKPAKKSWKDF